MENNNDILKELILKKEDKVAKLKQMIEKAKSLFQLDEETKRVLMDRALNITNKDKIILFLIGKYFQKELGLSQKSSVGIGEISSALNIPQTSLSAPLLELRENKLIVKEGSEYSILYEVIETSINRIYSLSIEKRQPEQKLRKKRRGVRKESSPKNLVNESVENLIKELKINEDEIKTIYSIKEKDFDLIKILNHEDIKKQHLDYALLVTFAYRYFYNIVQVDSTELRNKIKNTGCLSMINLSTNLKEYAGFIIHERGKKGNIYTSYRITQQGVEYTKKLIIKLINELRTQSHAHL